jgi:hypothetical protein
MPSPTPTPAKSESSPGPWPRPLVFAGVLGLLLLLAFPDVLLGWRTFCFRDYGHFAYPLAYHLRESFWRGEFPLWNPLNNCGIPFLAQWNTLALYPPSLFYLLLPLPWSLAAFSLLHLFWGGFGAYLLARRWTNSALGAAVAGVAFSLNGFALGSLVWPALTATLAWMPWVVLCGDRAGREGGRWIVAAALTGAMQMLTGTPEFIALTWLLLAGIVFLTADSLASWPRLAARLAGVVVLVTGLAAAQLLPFLELLRNSQRGAGFGNADWSLPASGLANFLVPMFHTYPTSHGVRLQFEQQWISSYYLGIGLLLLALFAVWRIRERRVAVLAIAAATSGLLAWGNHGLVYGWLLSAVPQLGVMRFPVKFLVVAVLCVPLLAAYAVALVERSEVNIRLPVQRIAALLAGLIGAVVLFDFKFPAHPEYPALARDTALNGGGQLFWLGLTAIALVLLSRARELPARRWLQSGLIALLAMDWLTHLPRQNPVIAPGAYAPGMVELPDRPDPLTTRAMISRDANQTLYERPAPDLREDFLRKRLALFSNFNLLEGVAKVNGFFPLYVRQERDVWSMLYETTNQPPAGLLDFLGVAVLTSPTNFVTWHTRGTAERIASGGQRVVFAEAKETLAKLADRTFSPRQVVYLPSEARASVPRTNGTPMIVRPELVSAHRLDFAITAQDAGLVVLAQTWYPAWQATVDGTNAPILRANHAFQAVAVPAGEHQVTFVYQDRAFRLGGFISLGALVVCVLLLVWPPRKERS